MSYDNNQFSPARLMANGTAGQLNPNAVAPQPTQAGDIVDPAYRAKATEAAVKFESFFIGKMLHQMRDGTRAFAAEDSPSKNRINDDMLDMADNLVADQLANRRAFGVADAILRQLLPQASPQPLPQQQAGTKANVADSQNSNKTLNQQQ